MVACGWVASNVPVIEPIAWERFDVSGSRYLVLRPYHLSGPGLSENHARFTERRFTAAVRPDADGDLDVDRICDAARTAAGYSEAPVHVILDNEANLHGRPVDTAYIHELESFTRRVQERLGPSFRYVGMPLAVAQNDEAWNEALRDVYARCDAIGVHCYGQQDFSLINRMLGLARMHGKPLVADEVGDSSEHLGDRERCASVAAYCRYLIEQPDVIALAIFIQGGRGWPIYYLPPEHLDPVARAFAAGHAEPEIKEETPGNPGGATDAAQNPHPVEPNGGTMALELKADNQFVARVGEPFTAHMHLEDTNTGQIVPIEGIATAFMRAPRDAEGYTLGFGDQISFDAENLDLDVSDVDGRFQFTFTVPEFGITAPTDTSLDVSVLAMQRQPVDAKHGGGSFPFKLLPAGMDSDGGDDDATDEPAVPVAPGRSPPAQEQDVWNRLVSIFVVAGTLAAPFPAIVPQVRSIHGSVDVIKAILGYPNSSQHTPGDSVISELTVIHERAGEMANKEPKTKPSAQQIQMDVAAIKALLGFR